MPKDVLRITEDVYLAVIGNPTPGKIRAHDDKGLPYLIDPPAVVPDPITQEREWRDAELSSVMWLRERHRDQKESGVNTTLSDEQFSELLVFLQALRDWPQKSEFPDSIYRPVPPSWIAQRVD
ncbi:phage tail protein [Pseudomonas reactans]|nr:phage tail protein [Pseudomonas reactans]